VSSDSSPFIYSDARSSSQDDKSIGVAVEGVHICPATPLRKVKSLRMRIESRNFMHAITLYEVRVLGRFPLI